MDQTLITRIVEAALLAANQPLTLAQLRGLFSLDDPAPDGSVELALETLQAGCVERGVELVELASGFRYQVKADVHPWVARLWSERQTRYTRATLETLALIAYRQPITRGEIEQVRGVAVNSNIIKALEEREWIRVVGHRDVPGKPELLATTKGFLDYFGLKRLDDLPPLSELKDIGELEPQLQFDGANAAEGMAVGDLSSADAGADEALSADTSADTIGADPTGSDSIDTDESVASDTMSDDMACGDEDSEAGTDTTTIDETFVDDTPSDGSEDASADPLSTQDESPARWQDESNDTALAEDGDSDRSNA
jgi:segregation and condensation protein B